MQIRKIDDSVYVSGQITIHDLPKLAQAGIRTLLCNRPDGEDAQQTNFAEIKQEAQRYNIKAYAIAVAPCGISAENLEEMLALLEQADYPLLAYCRSGTRSAALYQQCKIRQ